MAPWKRILVVDDDDDLRSVVADVLESNGYEVVAVDCGSEALAYLRTDRPALVLLDLRMPDMNGWEVLGALSADRWRDIPVVVITGAPPSSWPRTVRCLPKPFGMGDLLDTVSTLTAAG